MKTKLIIFLSVILLSAVSESIASEMLELDELKGLLELGVSQGEIAKAIRDADSLAMIEEDLPKIKGWGASEKIIEEIEKRLDEITISRVLYLVKRGVPDSKIIDKIRSGGKSFKLSLKDKLKLIRAKVNKDIILALEGKHILEGFKLYKDSLGFVSLQYPQNWNLYEWHTGGGFKILFSPESNVKAANEFTTGVQLQLGFVEKTVLDNSSFDIFDYHANELQALIYLNRQYGFELLPDPEGKPSRIQLGGYNAVKQSFKAVMLGTACLEDLIRCVAGGVHFHIEFIAPEGKYKDYKDTFKKIQDTIHPIPNQVKLERKSRAMTTSEVLERYKESVVTVVTEYGAGTGFFVREDGYILTNHHVVCNRTNEEGQPDHRGCTSPSQMVLAKDIKVLWDSTVGPKKEGEKHRTTKATLVDTFYSNSPQVDLALLKVPYIKEGYRAIPITAVGSGLVRAGDPIAAFGFPLPSRFGMGNMFATDGVISHINYIEQKYGDLEGTKKLNDLYSTAEIQPGNSGGPAIGLFTGGVVGLNTYVEMADAKTQLDYFGVCPIDHALYNFPQIKWYPKGRKTSAKESLELGVMLLAQKNYRSAGNEFLYALNNIDELLQDQKARLYLHLYVFFKANGQIEEAKAALSKCLEIDESFSEALGQMANLCIENNDLSKALTYTNRMIKASPDDYSPLVFRAEIYQRTKRYDDAEKDLQKAIQLGGSHDVYIYQIQGGMCYDQEKYEEGKKAFEKALKINPKDIYSRLEIARYYELKENSSGADLEYAKIAEEYKNEPIVHQRYGNFLKQQKGKENKALEHLARAIVLTMNKGDSPSTSLLNDTLNLSIEQRGNSDIAIFVGLCFNSYYPNNRTAVHKALAHYWNSQYILNRDESVKSGGQVIKQLKLGDIVERISVNDNTLEIAVHTNGTKTTGSIPIDAATQVSSLAGAHCAAYDYFYLRDYGENPNWRKNYGEVQPLSAAEFIWVINSGYDIILLGETLAESSIGFPMTSENIQILSQAKIDPSIILLLLYRSILDHIQGSEALASLIKVKSSGSVHSGGNTVYGTYTFENTANFALTGLVLRKTYYDSDNKILHSTDSVLSLVNPIFKSGEKRSIKIYYDTWDYLAKAGIKEDDITYYSLSVVSARNASAAKSLSFVDIRVTSEGIEFKLENPTFYPINKVGVRMYYVDKNEKYVCHPETGQPLVSPVIDFNVKIQPNSKSKTMIIKNEDITLSSYGEAAVSGEPTIVYADVEG